MSLPPGCSLYTEWCPAAASRVGFGWAGFINDAMGEEKSVCMLPEGKTNQRHLAKAPFFFYVFHLLPDEQASIKIWSCLCFGFILWVWWLHLSWGGILVKEKNTIQLASEYQKPGDRNKLWTTEWGLESKEGNTATFHGHPECMILLV